jgi:8-amino-7-oxononanoate synthase
MHGSASLQQRLQLRLQDRAARQLLRQRRQLQSPQQPELQVDGRRLLAFCSNDYLGLANHPAVVAAYVRGLATYGAGSGASHLVAGHSAAHQALEEELAAFTGRSRALLFGSGFMANIGVLTTLLDERDTVFEDKLNHASLLDGGLFSKARFQRFPHRDLERLDVQLQTAGSEGLRLIVTDGVFSMDGDVAPLEPLLALAERHHALLMVDDAHGLGCLGQRGGGVLEAARESGVCVDEERLPILMGTLGKAFGTLGAFVAGSSDLIEALVQFCRPYIYTTALPAAMAEATRASLRLVETESWRRDRLRQLIQRFRSGASQLGLPIADSPTQIQALILGTPERALLASQQLEAQGLLVTAIRPPTVPPGTARLRISLSAAHSDAQVDRLLQALASLVLPPADEAS